MHNYSLLEIVSEDDVKVDYVVVVTCTSTRVISHVNKVSEICIYFFVNSILMFEFLSVIF